MTFLLGGANSASGGYNIDNSLRYNNPDDPSLAITFGSAGNRRTFTISAWVKRGNIADDHALFGQGGTSSGNPRGVLFFANSLRFTNNTSGSTTDTDVETNAKTRDPSAWYHAVVAVDTTQGTNSNRVKLYLNGELQTSLATTTYPDQNFEMGWNNNVLHTVGRYPNNDAYHMDGYISEFYFIDGTQYAASDFGETDDNGIWIPKAASVTFGTNGFKLEFKETGTGTASASTIGADTSGNTNHLTSTNLAATDVTTDTPTNNFATLNPFLANTQIGFSEGNCKMSSVPASDTNYLGAWSSIGVTKGKWYAEFKVESELYSSLGTDSTTLIGAGSGTYTAGNQNHNMAITGYCHWWLDHTDKRVVADGDLDATAIATIAQNDIVGCMLNADEGKVWFQQNGVTVGSASGYDFIKDASSVVPTSGSGFQHFIPVVREASGSIYGIVNCNFGNPAFAISSGNADANGYGNFEYAVPSGYYALCTKNLAEYG